MSTNKPKTLWRKKLHEIIYEADTSAGKFFDVFLLIIILCCGCSHTKKPHKQEENWLKIYENELNVARENDDINAWIFFWPEYIKELQNRSKN